MNWQQRNLAGGRLIFCNFLYPSDLSTEALAEVEALREGGDGKWLDFRNIGRRERYALQSLGEGGFFNIFLDKLDKSSAIMAREIREIRSFLARAENIINPIIQFQ